MALISFKDWRAKQNESSPQTRLMTGIARGNYPPTASPFSRSTPEPWKVKANDKALRKRRKKKKKKRPAPKKD